MGAVKNLCKRGVVLDQGQVAFDGGVDESIDFYTNHRTSNNIFYKKISDATSDKEAQFLDVSFAQQKNIFASTEPIEFIFSIHANKTIPNCRINTTIFAEDGSPVGSVSNIEKFEIQKGETKKISFILQNNHFALGCYTASFSIGTGNFLTCQTDYDVIRNILSFEIDSLDQQSEEAIAQWNYGWGKIMLQSKMRELQL